MRLLCALLLATLLAGCGAVTPLPRYTTPAARQRAHLVEELEQRRQADQARLQKVVQGYLGIPYRWGGTTLQGMDCSALVRAIYRQTYGVELPRTSRQMYQLGQSVDDPNRLRPGDLLFFRDPSSGPGVSHVGVYLGEGRFAHTRPHTGSIITAMADPFYTRNYVGARRVLP